MKVEKSRERRRREGDQGEEKAGLETRSESFSWPPEQVQEEEENTRVGAFSLVDCSL